MTDPRASAKIAPLLDPHEALRWLDRGSGGPQRAAGASGSSAADAACGALAFVVTRARGSAVRVTANPDAMGRIHRALDAALSLPGVTRVLLWQLDGRVAAVGEPVAIAGAVGEGRAEALAAVDALLAGLKGVATREDV
jgi:hypothetical protein